MKRKLIFVLIPILILIMPACTVYKKSIPTTPILTQINLSMSDLNYLGEVTGTTTQSYFLFIPYGGEKYTYAASVIGGGNGPPNVRKRGFNNALYKALMERPDADFVLPLNMEVTSHRMFLGREETITLRAKAFKVITK